MDDQTGRVSGAGADRELDADTEERAREIRTEIHETREQLAETVEAIQEKLRPANVVASAASATTERVRDMAYNAAERADELWDSSGASRFVDRLTAKPVPLAMTLIGAAWLMMGGDRDRQQYGSRRVRTSRAYSSGADYPAGARYASGSEDASGREDATRNDYDYEYDYARNRSYTDRSQSVGRFVSENGRRVQSMVREYPLAVGAAALILGASLGMVVPETEAENQMMGETRDLAMQRAQEAATGAVGKVKEATADVVTRAALGD
jgi:hypothetical protein